MTLPDSLDLPELVGGKYRPIGVIGVGAMGTVYQVEHILTGELLALKVMTAHQGATREAVERFKREARASSKIKSEHVVRVTDADVAPEFGRAPYLVMDFLDGADLEKVSADLPVPPAEVVEWMRQIARALDKAHRLGITHRDLKPENLFLTQREDGSPLIKILDFGIAKIAAESTGTTQTGQILGTPLYMSPEQARGDPNQIGPSSDLYALGLITFKLLTGAPYWKANSVAGIIGQILYEPMPPPVATGCTFGPAFDEWFLKACHRDSSQRFRTTHEQVEALAKALGLPFDARSEGHRSNPGAVRESGTGSSLTAVAAERRDPEVERPAAETLAQSGGTLVSSSRGIADVRVATSQPRRRKVIFYAVMSAMVLVSIIVVTLHGQQSRTPVPPTEKVLSALVESPEVVAPQSASPIAIPSAPVIAASSAHREPEKAAMLPNVAGLSALSAKRKEPVKSPLAHSAAAVPAPLRTEKLVPNDPLSDQK